MEDEVKMVVSCIVVKDKRMLVRVSFMRGKDYAEGVLPDGVIERSEGFSREETEKLERYIRENRKNILDRAKEINPVRNFLES